MERPRSSKRPHFMFNPLPSTSSKHSGSEEVFESLFSKTKKRSSQVSIRPTPPQVPKTANRARERGVTRDITHLKDKLSFRAKKNQGSLDSALASSQVLPVSPVKIRSSAQHHSQLWTVRQDKSCGPPPPHSRSENCLEALIKKRFSKMSFKEAFPKTPSGPEREDFIYLGDPTGRQEVANLTEWFEYMTVNYLSYLLKEDSLQSVPPAQRAQDLDLARSIIVLGVNEIVRQVSVTCVGRGQLLQEFFRVHKEFIELQMRLEKAKLLEKVHSLNAQIAATKQLNEASQLELLEQIKELRIRTSENTQNTQNNIEVISKLEEQLNLERNRKPTPKTETRQLPSALLSDQHKGLRLKPTYSKRLESPGYGDPFFQSVQCQANLRPNSKENWAQVLLLTQQQESQTDPLVPISRMEGRGSARFEIPNSITVTTEKNEIFVEYALVPNRNTEGLRPDSSFSHMSASESSDSDGFLLDLGKRHRSAQTDTDLILNNEEQEILDEVIEYKNELLKQAEQKLALAKSRLLAISAQHSAEELPPEEPRASYTETEFWEPTGPDIEDPQLVDTGKAHPRKSELRRINSRTKIHEFNFHQPEKRLQKRESHPAKQLLQGILRRSSDLHKYNTISKKMLLRKILLIYSSAISRESGGEALPPLAEFCYTYIQNRHQETIIGEKKFLEVVAAALSHHEILKVSAFIRLLGFGASIELEDYVRPAHAFTFFIGLLSCIARSKIGITLSSHNTGDTLYIPTIRAAECVREAFVDMLAPSHVQNLLKALEKISKQDPLKINTGGVVDQDLVLDLAMEEYEQHSRDVLDAVGLLVQGFDLENRRMIHASEFVMSIRYLTPENLWVVVRGAGFVEYSQVVSSLCVSTEKGTGFLAVEDVAELCIKHSLVSMENVRRYLKNAAASKVQTKDGVRNLLIARLDLINLIVVHRERLGVTEEVERLWRDKMELLSGNTATNDKSLCLAFLLFIDELERLKKLI